ncbi:MAG: hypothetical protein RQ899_01570 [Pseudomonadales bacterium]|nr:hypothetical protein [Pseudomonadales bacterium]
MDRYEQKDGTPTILVNPVDRLSKTRGWYTVKRSQTLLTPSRSLMAP